MNNYNYVKQLDQDRIDQSARRRELNQLVAFSEAGHVTDMDDVMKRNNIRYGMSYADFDDLINWFDISRLPDYEGMPVPLVGHIIFTRPSLNVNVYTRDANFEAMAKNSLCATYVNDRYGKKLLHMLSDNNTSSMYMPIFTTRATSYSVQDMALKTVEKAQTYYGHVIKYGKHSEEHKVGGSITLDFRNDRFNSILKTIHLWASYIWIVSKNDSIEPTYIHQANGILDYCGSIYYLVSDMAMNRLYYWEKLTGVFPKTIPYSIFSYSDAPILEDKVSIEFEYGVRSDPCDPEVLFDINVLSSPNMGTAVSYFATGVTGQRTPTFNGNTSAKKSGLVRPDSFERPFGLGNAFARFPIIQQVRSAVGDISYHLQYTTSVAGQMRWR